MADERKNPLIGAFRPPPPQRNLPKADGPVQGPTLKKHAALRRFQAQRASDRAPCPQEAGSAAKREKILVNSKPSAPEKIRKSLALQDLCGFSLSICILFAFCVLS